MSGRRGVYASATSMRSRPGCSTMYSSTTRRQRRHTSWPSGRYRVYGLNSPGSCGVQSGSAGSLPTGHTASTRKPSTPRSNQKRSASVNISSTAGWRWSKSGWYGVNVPRYHSPGGSSVGHGRPHRPAEHGRPVVRRLAVRRGRGGTRSGPARRCPGPAARRPGTTGAGRCSGSGRCRGARGCRGGWRRRRARRRPRGRRTPDRRRSSRRRRSRGRAAATGRRGTARWRRRRATRCGRGAGGGPRGRRCRHRRRRRTSARTPGRRRHGSTSGRPRRRFIGSPLRPARPRRRRRGRGGGRRSRRPARR